MAIEITACHLFLSLLIPLHRRSRRRASSWDHFANAFSTHELKTLHRSNRLIDCAKDEDDDEWCWSSRRHFSFAGPYVELIFLGTCGRSFTKITQIQIFNSNAFQDHFNGQPHQTDRQTTRLTDWTQSLLYTRSVAAATTGSYYFRSYLFLVVVSVHFTASDSAIHHVLVKCLFNALKVAIWSQRILIIHHHSVAVATSTTATAASTRKEECGSA